ncbi:MAG: MarR family transcriptional regulator [Bacteroidales bacterium]|nr:MarR family transcriptional regulator [Bacteroidales bacterium]
MDTTEILIKIRRIVRSINLESKKIQKEYGVSIPQALCLGYLHRSPDFQSTQGAMCRFLNLNSSTVSGIVDRLERKGYVARLPKSGDKRVMIVALTSSGSKLLSRIPFLLHEQLTEKLNKLDPEHLKRMEDTLDMLINLLNIHEIKSIPVIAIDHEPEELDEHHTLP